MLYAHTPEEAPVPTKLGLDDLEIIEEKAGQMIQAERTTNNGQPGITL